MRMKMAGSLWAASFLSLSAGCLDGVAGVQTGPRLGSQEAKAEQECVEQFEGITHCASGNATLTPTDRGLEVSGLTHPEEDGVSSHFEGAVSWAQEAVIGLGGEQGHFSLAARDGDQVVSTLQVTRGGEPNELLLAPSFTGGSPAESSYRVNVYQDGELTGTIAGSPGLRVSVWWGWFPPRPVRSEFEVSRASNPDAPVSEGACVWRLHSGDGSFTAVLDGEEVVGDSIEFVEDINDGAYPYMSFSGIDVRSDAQAYTLLGESMSRE